MYSLDIDSASTGSAMIHFIREQTDQFEREGAVLGVGGGIDSAVLAAFASRALRPKKILTFLDASQRTADKPPTSDLITGIIERM